MSPSCYHAFGKRGKSAREVEDERLSTKIAAIYAANYNCYGARKIWHALPVSFRNGTPFIHCVNSFYNLPQTKEVINAPLRDKGE
ncbi:hypothetical protein FACS1894216_12000 [Synergistales bacterium]|nr:hypothetical protein FACS1894216_12000 [Synergistales bacterium]